MTFIVIVFIVFLVGLAVDIIGNSKIGWRHGYWKEWFISVISGIILALSIIAIPVSHLSIKMELNNFEVQRETLDAFRKTNPEGYETAAAFIKASGLNGWLADMKYIKSRRGFNWYIPDEIMDVEPIK